MIERGRQFELDRTDAARATVRINDTEGVLDPTNPSGPYYGDIQPLTQAVWCAWNPVDSEWEPRFRGWINDLRYLYDPSQRVNFLEVDLVDIFEILAAIEMLPGSFGDAPPSGLEGQVFYEDATMDDRIVQALTDSGIPAAFYVVFTGNVTVIPTVYTPGESPMTAIQEAADAEFPGVSNVYTDRFGRLAVHGRLAKFDPATTSAVAGDAAWDWRHWNAGDGEAVAAAPSITAHMRGFGFNRGLSSIRNSAIATPYGIDDDDVSGQIVQDLASIAQYGLRSWSAQDLLTQEGLLDSSSALVETRRFAEYITMNYGQPRDRIGPVTFRSMNLGQTGYVVNWRLLTQIDISDQLDASILAPGGGGFIDEECFVEGIREEHKPANTDFDDVTVTVDLSPVAYFTEIPFPT